MRLDLLILVRLAHAKKLGPSGLAKSLWPIVDPGVDEKSFKRITLEPRIEALVAGGWVKRRPFEITDSGRARAAKELGGGSVPRWEAFRSRVIPAQVLGLGTSAKAELRLEVLATVLKEKPATQARLLDAMVRVELGIVGKVSLDVIRARLLARHLDLPTRSMDVDVVIDQVVGKAMETARADAKTLQRALIKRWVGEPPVVTEPKLWNDDDVISAVKLATVRVPAVGRFGDDRVFVSALWRQLDEGAGFPGLTLEGLKERLVVANRKQQVTLARADLVGAMDAREVAVSEIRFLNSTFHFVLDRSRA